MTRPRHVLQAGGALTISTAAAARDQGLPMPAGLLALSPWSDLADNDSSPSWRSQRDFLPPALVQQMARAYAGAASEMEASACNVDLHLDHARVGAATGNTGAWQSEGKGGERGRAFARTTAGAWQSGKSGNDGARWGAAWPPATRALCL